ncbi:unnamed protein product [Allacma fusca]|uniref:Uncharacterized protein n=1 Tax=Allacma fusca TaxID=39272 RepID=A0A8J2NXL6_9HEXA|nr:unnamed protein product [Allacma fusca]
MANADPRITREARIFFQVLGLDQKIDGRLDEMNDEQLRRLIGPDGEGLVVSNYRVCKKFIGLILQQIWWRVIFPILVGGALIVGVIHVTGKLSGSSTSSLNSSGTLNATLPSMLEPTEAAPTFFNYDQDDNKLKKIFGKQQDFTQSEILFVPIKSTSTAVVTTPTVRPEPDVPETAVSSSESPNHLSSSTPQTNRVCSEYVIREFYHEFRVDYREKCNSTIVPSYQGVILQLVTCTQCVFTEVTIKNYKNLKLAQIALKKADVVILDLCNASQNEASLVQLNNLDLPNLKHLSIGNQVKPYSCSKLIETISTWRAPIRTLGDNILDRVSVVGFESFVKKDFRITIESLKTFQFLVDSFEFKQFPDMFKISPNNQTITWVSTGDAHVA